MSDDQFMQLYSTIQDMQKQMATRDDIAELRDEMQTGFDQIASRLDVDDTERAALESQAYCLTPFAT